jgi:hypothetical protein
VRRLRKQPVHKAILALLLWSACGDYNSRQAPPAEDEQPTPTPVVCAKPRGIYHMVWKRTSGNCRHDDSTDAVINFDASHPYPAVGTLQSGCTGPITTDKTCAISFDEMCDYTQVTGLYYRLTGKIHWSADGDTGMGLLTFANLPASPADACTDTYSANYTRP